MPTELQRELTALLNRYSVESQSNTPDFILADFLLGCLAAWDTAVTHRETWFGRSLSETPKPLDLILASVPAPTDPEVNIVEIMGRAHCAHCGGWMERAAMPESQSGSGWHYVHIKSGLATCREGSGAK